MDDFAKEAFTKAEHDELMKECDAWGNVSRDEKKIAMTASIVSVGTEEMSKLITLILKAGMDDVMHAYENALMMGGFSLGYKAGRESMLEDVK